MYTISTVPKYKDLVQEEHESLLQNARIGNVVQNLYEEGSRIYAEVDPPYLAVSALVMI